MAKERISEQNGGTPPTEYERIPPKALAGFLDLIFQEPDSHDMCPSLDPGICAFLGESEYAPPSPGIAEILEELNQDRGNVDELVIRLNLNLHLRAEGLYHP